MFQLLTILHNNDADINASYEYLDNGDHNADHWRHIIIIFICIASLLYFDNEMKYSDSLKRYINLSSRSSLLLKLPTEAFVKDDFTCEYPRTLLIRLSPVQRPCCEC